MIVNRGLQADHCHILNRIPGIWVWMGLRGLDGSMGSEWLHEKCLLSGSMKNNVRGRVQEAAKEDG